MVGTNDLCFVKAWVRVHTEWASSGVGIEIVSGQEDHGQAIEVEQRTATTLRRFDIHMGRNG